MQHTIVSVRTATCVQAELQEYLQDVLNEAGVEHVDELLSANIAKDWPRTARVNLLKMSVEEALAWLRSPPLSHQKLATLVCCITVRCDVLQYAPQKSKQYVCALSKQYVCALSKHSSKMACGMQRMQLVEALMLHTINIEVARIADACRATRQQWMSCCQMYCCSQLALICMITLL